MKRHSTYLAQHFRIAQDDDTILRSRESDVQTPRIVQEADTLMLIAPDAAKDDVVLLSTLERIHASNFNLLVEVLLQGSVELHVVHDVRALSFVWGDNADLAGDNSRLEELGDDLLNIRRLGSNRHV